jgi:hypothetical protein
MKERKDLKFGGASRDRTDGLVVANDALSQLSYSPTGECLLISQVILPVFVLPHHETQNKSRIETDPRQQKVYIRFIYCPGALSRTGYQRKTNGLKHP